MNQTQKNIRVISTAGHVNNLLSIEDHLKMIPFSPQEGANRLRQKMSTAMGTSTKATSQIYGITGGAQSVMDQFPFVVPEEQNAAGNSFENQNRRSRVTESIAQQMTGGSFSNNSGLNQKDYIQKIEALSHIIDVCQN